MAFNDNLVIRFLLSLDNLLITPDRKFIAAGIK